MKNLKKYSVFIGCQLAIFLSVPILPYEEILYMSFLLHASTACESQGKRERVLNYDN